MGLVIERRRRARRARRPAVVLRALRQRLLYQEFFALTDIERQFPPVFERFFGNLSLRTCKHCHAVMERAGAAGRTRMARSERAQWARLDIDGVALLADLAAGMSLARVHGFSSGPQLRCFGAAAASSCRWRWARSAAACARRQLQLQRADADAARQRHPHRKRRRT